MLLQIAELADTTNKLAVSTEDNERSANEAQGTVAGGVQF